jgi:L-alanine-DL-glutamate epimerase-like enolase superfamily enzyme
MKIDSVDFFYLSIPTVLDIAAVAITRDSEGYICVPEKPGLGISVNTQALKKYLVDVEIKVKGERLYYTPEF